MTMDFGVDIDGSAVGFGMILSRQETDDKQRTASKDCHERA
jgi:hypothetical protein